MSKYKKLIVALTVIISIILVGIFGKTIIAQSISKDNRIQIVFWHEMGGPAEKTLIKMVNDFNSSQDKYQVVPKYQGSYDTAIQKIFQTHGTSTSPAVFQSSNISTAQVLKSGYTTPVQKFVNRDHFDLNKISPVARAFHAQGGEQQAMPFNTSQPVLYYNATLLEKYGITPPSTSPSYSEITKISEELYEKSHHQVKGMTVQIYGWLLEEAIANNGGMFTNQNDGHTGNPTKVSINSPEAIAFFKWIRKNIKNGDFMDYGSGTMASTNQTSGFLTNKVGMYIQSSASMSQLNKKNKNKLGVTYFPHADGKAANGVSIGGAALWISNDKPQEIQQGAYEFIKYTVKPEVQAQWQKSTGYMALNKNSKDTKILKQFYAKHSEGKIPSQQLQNTIPNYGNSGILLEGMQGIRKLEENAMEKIYRGGDIEKVLQQNEDAINEIIYNQNRANGYK
ncbi:ABC transporter substrate-binding protein [Companilactobacillus alimentarius]|uniref:ABC transporter substrate-binding protein n=1 Tax=Companilactobacillus alimentarius DSM 20249 TaxID=1423720 RepID=A0A2K9HIV1_9LACO|nr:ABC transporter substrate-binding protein [Companilactobacillus alimentarius]AUI72474.1 ABC transporter substrate-binding protein [Companilactobacillus alimentarius DSM 20249]KRK77757.1 family 1 extracellular solute-binding protein [Companilactobacillus alimentarius DSM 20249]GEO45004.1 ABC transporter substrate-binding protein [Companilactobacillus alimentarius]